MPVSQSSVTSRTSLNAALSERTKVPKTFETTNALIAAVFPTMAARSNAYPFYFFSAMMALQCVLVLFIFPETTGVSLEKVQANLGIAKAFDGSDSI